MLERHRSQPISYIHTSSTFYFIKYSEFSWSPKIQYLFYTILAYSIYSIQYTHTVFILYNTHIQYLFYTILAYSIYSIQYTHTVFILYNTHIQYLFYTIHAYSIYSIQYTHTVFSLRSY